LGPIGFPSLPFRRPSGLANFLNSPLPSPALLGGFLRARIVSAISNVNELYVFALLSTVVMRPASRR
jgi:hypothetical protein